MALMEFLKATTVNTTTMIKASTGTGTFANLYDRNTDLSYSTVGHTTNTSTLISIEFAGPTVLSNLLILNHNLKQFRVFYNSATANTFTPDINQTTNSQSTSYISFASVTVSSIQLQMDVAMSADVEKRVGELIPTERRLQFVVNPTTANYRPATTRTKVLHKMPDGGVTIYNIKNKFKARVKLEFISSAFRNSLKQVFDEAQPVIFLPFPTTGSDWDGAGYEVLWTDDFDFTFGENSKTQGYTGEFELMETPSA